MTSRLSSCSLGNSTKRSSKKCTRSRRPSQMVQKEPAGASAEAKSPISSLNSRRAAASGVAAPDTTTGQVPPGSIQATYQQESGSYIDRYRDALMPRTRKSPPDTGKRETDPEAVRQARCSSDESGARLKPGMAQSIYTPPQVEAHRPNRAQVGVITIRLCPGGSRPPDA